MIDMVRGVGIAMQQMHIELQVSEISPMELVGVHPSCLLMKTKSSFEEAHHWNIQAKFYSVKSPHSYAIMI